MINHKLRSRRGVTESSCVHCLMSVIYLFSTEMDDLLAMGFNEVSSQAALRKAGGNVDRAIDLLLSNSIESSDGAGDLQEVL